MKEYSTRKELANKENAVILRMKKAEEGNDFGSAEIYVKTTDKSGDYYVKYNLAYEKNPIGATTKDKDGNIVPLTYYNGSNGGHNRSNYRIRTATLCKLENGDFINVFDVLQQGEISMAVKEKNKETGMLAGDFVGGFHGDENIKFDGDTPLASLAMDGKEISLNGEEEREYTGNTVTFEQTTIINRCNTPGENIIEHNQIFTFDTNGINVKQTAEFITDEYEDGGKYALDNNGSYLQMCTFWRLNSKNYNERVCDDLKFYDENGKLVNEFNTKDYNHGDFGWTGVETETINRTVEYNGYNGLYGLVGYKILNNSTACQSSKIMIRTFGDNKWYCTFKSANPNNQPKKGEKWQLELLYYIDYNTER